MAEPELDEQEMKDILVKLARNETNAAAAIAALKELRQMGLGKKPVDAFAELDGDELAPRRDSRQAS